MIVRIATEGQYRLPDERRGRLDEVDDAVVQAVEAADQQRFADLFTELLEFVRAGERLDDAHLGQSDVIMPPPGTSLEEAAAEFTGEGLLPG